MKIKIALIFIALTLAACGEYKGTPTEFSQVCAVGSEKKMIETEGFLTTGVTVFCSSRSGAETCGLVFKQNPSDEKGISADVPTGSGPNTMDKLEKSFKKEDLKIRDNFNADVTHDKVKVTGEVIAVQNTINAQETICYMKVRKIEK